MHRIGKTWRAACDSAPIFAERLSHSAVGPEHLLFAVLETRNRVVIRFCREFRISAEVICTNLVCKVGRHTPRPGFRWAKTRPFENVLEKAHEEAEALGHIDRCSEHLLLALLQVPEDETSIVRDVLVDSGVDVDVALEFVRAEIARGISPQREYVPSVFTD